MVAALFAKLHWINQVYKCLTSTSANPAVPMKAFATLPSPKANAYPTRKKTMADIADPNRFFMKMFCVLAMRARPVSHCANLQKLFTNAEVACVACYPFIAERVMEDQILMNDIPQLHQKDNN